MEGVHHYGAVWTPWDFENADKKDHSNFITFWDSKNLWVKILLILVRFGQGNRILKFFLCRLWEPRRIQTGPTRGCAACGRHWSRRSDHPIKSSTTAIFHAPMRCSARQLPFAPVAPSRPSSSSTPNAQGQGQVGTSRSGVHHAVHSPLDWVSCDLALLPAVHTNYSYYLPVAVHGHSQISRMCAS
jgi:hypothetical protein